jgi:hypothetical protein
MNCIVKLDQFCQPKIKHKLYLSWWIMVNRALVTRTLLSTHKQQRHCRMNRSIGQIFGASHQILGNWISIQYSRGKEAYLKLIYPRPCKNLSILFLNPLIGSHAIIFSYKLFQISITRCATENFLISKRHLGFS